jgi:hypothetical protein
METSTMSPLVAALYGHFQASLHLIQVVLMLEWTIFTRLFAFLVVLTFSYIFYILITLRHGRHPLMIWEKLGKPVVKLFRPWTFAKLVGSSDPYARSIGNILSILSNGVICLHLSFK